MGYVLILAVIHWSDFSSFSHLVADDDLKYHVVFYRHTRPKQYENINFILLRIIEHGAF